MLHINLEFLLIYIFLGLCRWKDPQNAYRTKWNVNNIPALVRYESVNGEVVETGRLVEGEILDQEKLGQFIGSR